MCVCVCVCDSVSVGGGQHEQNGATSLRQWPVKSPYKELSTERPEVTINNITEQ